MKIDDDFPLLMTAAEAADYLAVPVETVALWLRNAKLLAAARGENGVPLIYRWRVERDGPRLAAEEPVRVAKNPRGHISAGRKTLLIDPRALACGCSVAASDGAVAPRPIFLCTTARALEASTRLARAFLAVAPHDPFFERLAAVTEDALAAHFAAEHPQRRPAEDDMCRVSRDSTENTANPPQLKPRLYP
jgi:hypothetical protein